MFLPGLAIQQTRGLQVQAKYRFKTG